MIAYNKVIVTIIVVTNNMTNVVNTIAYNKVIVTINVVIDNATNVVIVIVVQTNVLLPTTKVKVRNRNGIPKISLELML
jgi:hypothetical protein